MEVAHFLIKFKQSSVLQLTFNGNFLSMRSVYPKYILLSLLLTASANCLQAQFADNFTDGDFTQNPSWTGDDAKWEVNAGNQLQLSGLSKTDTVYLSTINTRLQNTEWKFYVRLGFAPSNSNFAKIYLASSSANLRTSLSGYYIRLGTSGNKDAVELYKQQGLQAILLAKGPPAHVAKSNNTLSIKVRHTQGLWQVYADTLGNNNYNLECTAKDSAIVSAQFFGFWCRHTSTNRNKFYFDNVSITSLVKDSIAPSLLLAKAVNSSQLSLLFDEALDKNTAGNISNYQIAGLGTPTAASINPQNSQEVKLSFAISFSNKKIYSVQVKNIADENGNLLNSASATFQYFAPYAPKSKEVIFTEFFPDPSPPQDLPEKEFIEIYNNTDEIIWCKKWLLKDLSSQIVFPNKRMEARSYYILCNANDTLAYQKYGKTIGLSSLPSLNNDADHFYLLDSTGYLIDDVAYKDTWYRDNFKKEGGFTLERIDNNFICDNEYNWQASNSTVGGTPGQENSIKAIFVDTARIKASYAVALNDSVIQVYFSKALDSTQLNDKSLYTLSHNLQVVSIAVASAFSQMVELKLSEKLQVGRQYTLSLTKNLSDCPGNVLLAGTTLNFAVAEQAAIGDLHINEILFDPIGSDPDFVEIYNSSSKSIDLQTLQIANASSSARISLGPRVLQAKSYVVISENTEAIRNRYKSGDASNFIEISDLPSFNNDEGTILLLDKNAAALDSFSYNEKMHYPLLSNTEGISLEKIVSENANTSNNWHSAASALMATPGYRNSQNLDGLLSDGELSFYPDPFSPDNDGYEDNLRIHYKMPENGLLGNVYLFDRQGRMLLHLVNNELLAAEGDWFWNGLLDNDSKAAIGIYICLLEALSPKTGKKYTYKKTLVVAGKLR